MSADKPHYFRGDEWYNRMMYKRVKDALALKERKFGLEHCGDTDGQLLVYLRSCAFQIGRSPFPSEVIGHGLILERFGSWNRALDLAALEPVCGTPPKVTKRLIVRQELAVQQKLYRQEREAKRLEKMRKHD